MIGRLVDRQCRADLVARHRILSEVILGAQLKRSLLTDAALARRGRLAVMWHGRGLRPLRRDCVVRSAGSGRRVAALQLHVLLARPLDGALVAFVAAGSLRRRLGITAMLGLLVALFRDESAASSVWIISRSASPSASCGRVATPDGAALGLAAWSGPTSRFKSSLMLQTSPMIE